MHWAATIPDASSLARARDGLRDITRIQFAPTTNSMRRLRALFAAVSLGAKGLVIAGIGAGAIGNLTDECKAIAASGRAVVVRAARVGEGRVLLDSAYHETNMIAAGNLLPQKAALLLSLALTVTQNLSEIQRMFDEY